MSLESTDPVVRQIAEALTDEEAREIEARHLVETAKQPEDPGFDDADGWRGDDADS